MGIHESEIKDSLTEHIQLAFTECVSAVCNFFVFIMVVTFLTLVVPKKNSEWRNKNIISSRDRKEAAKAARRYLRGSVNRLDKQPTKKKCQYLYRRRVPSVKELSDYDSDVPNNTRRGWGDSETDMSDFESEPSPGNASQEDTYIWLKNRHECQPILFTEDDESHSLVELDDLVDAHRANIFCVADVITELRFPKVDQPVQQEYGKWGDSKPELHNGHGEKLEGENVTYLDDLEDAQRANIFCAAGMIRELRNPKVDQPVRRDYGKGEDAKTELNNGYEQKLERENISDLDDLVDTHGANIFSAAGVITELQCSKMNQPVQLEYNEGGDSKTELNYGHDEILDGEDTTDLCDLVDAHQGNVVCAADVVTELYCPKVEQQVHQEYSDGGVSKAELNYGQDEILEGGNVTDLDDLVDAHRANVVCAAGVVTELHCPKEDQQVHQEYSEEDDSKSEMNNGQAVILEGENIHDPNDLVDTLQANILCATGVITELRCPKVNQPVQQESGEGGGSNAEPNSGHDGEFEGDNIRDLHDIVEVYAANIFYVEDVSTELRYPNTDQPVQWVYSKGDDSKTELNNGQNENLEGENITDLHDLVDAHRANVVCAADVITELRYPSVYQPVQQEYSKGGDSKTELNNGHNEELEEGNITDLDDLWDAHRANVVCAADVITELRCPHVDQPVRQEYSEGVDPKTELNSRHGEKLEGENITGFSKQSNEGFQNSDRQENILNNNTLDDRCNGHIEVKSGNCSAVSEGDNDAGELKVRPDEEPGEQLSGFPSVGRSFVNDQPCEGHESHDEEETDITSEANTPRESSSYLTA